MIILELVGLNLITSDKNDTNAYEEMKWILTIVYKNIILTKALITKVNNKQTMPYM